MTLQYLARLNERRTRLERKAAVGSLGRAVLNSDARRQGLKGASKMAKNDLAGRVKMAPDVAVARRQVANVLKRARKELGLRSKGQWSTQNAKYLENRLKELEGLNLDEATLKQVRTLREQIGAGTVTTGREARSALLAGGKVKATRKPRAPKKASPKRVTTRTPFDEFALERV